MREILFRGKDVLHDIWVYGSLIKTGNFCCILPDDDGTNYDYPYLDPDLGTIDGYASPVDSETVGQWTGTYDKNGKKIFEGDIVTVAGVAYVCRWDEGNVEFGLVNEKESFGIAYVVPNVKVVGNIYDNPELLREGAHV